MKKISLTLLPELGSILLWKVLNYNYALLQKKLLVLALYFKAQKAIGLSILLALLASNIAFAQPVAFNTSLILNVGERPKNLVTADFNNDKVPDIAVIDEFSTDISVLIGTSEGLFRDTLNFPLSNIPQEIATGDFNNDGFYDLLIINAQDQVLLLLGEKSPNANKAAFAAPKPILSTFAPQSLLVEDFDQDNNDDIVIAGDFLHILFGKGDGNFEDRGQNIIIAQASNLVVSGDFDGNGALDIVAVDAESQKLKLLLRSPNTPVFSQSDLDLDFIAFNVVSGDFDKDGKSDLAFTSKFNENVFVFYGARDGKFSDPVSINIGLGNAGINAADFNDDQITDLAISNEPDNQVFVLLGKEDRSFEQQSTVNTGISPQFIISEDFNTDGILDLLTINRASGNLSLFLGQSNNKFPNSLNLATNPSPFNVVTGDFNNDGYMDIVTANSHFGLEDASLSVFLNDQNGGFQTAISVSLLQEGTSFTTQDVAAKDFNSDGYLDLAAVNTDGLGCIIILEGKGDGTFINPEFICVGGKPQSIIADDFNNDNFIDLAYVDQVSPGSSNGQVGVLLGLNDLMFKTPKFFPVGIGSRELTSADIDGDLETDIIVTNSSESTISILFGLGESQRIFSDEPLTLTTASGFPPFPLGIKTGDFDQDNRTDLAVTGVVSNDVTILLSRGELSQTGLIFRSSGSFQVGTAPFELTVNDFNQDGRLDVATSNAISSSTTVWLGNGEGDLEIRTDWGTGISPLGITSGDFNNDKFPDLVTANELSDDISILFNVTPPQAPAPVVSDLLLINADADSIVGPLLNNSDIDIAKVNFQISVLAEIDQGEIGSVRFELRRRGDSFQKFRQENFFPYTFAGNEGADFAGFDLPLGQYDLKVIPYPLRNGRGLPGEALQVTFNVINSGVSVPSEEDTLAVNEEDSFIRTLQAYPNIAQDVVHFDLELQEPAKGIFQLYNRQGALLFETEFVDALHTQLDISRWGRGMYFARVISNQEQVGKTVRIVIQ